MNYKMVKYLLGKMLGAEGLLLLFPCVVSMIYRERVWIPFLFVAVVLVLLSVLLSHRRPAEDAIYAREGFVVVALTWILWSMFGALPFYLSGWIPRYVDAFFETVSGFTTTGATILSDIEGLPKGLNFWRCFTHWVGGMGVLVFAMAIVPMGEKRSMFLMRAEMAGMTCEKLVPKARSTAKILYGMYLMLSVIQVILLLLGGMDLYDSVIHTFSTAGTGGFNNRNTSVGYYDSAYIDGVITVFMLLFGINFNLYYLMLLGQFKDAIRSEELKTYLGVVAVTTALITANIAHLYETPLKAFRYAVFQVASIITTTGFATADFDLWPELSKCLILLLIVTGACAGSTGGGMKVSRIILLVKTITREVRQILHPQSVNVVKLDGKRVADESVQSLYVYVICYVMILAGSVVLISVNDFDFATSFSAVLTMLNNVGPGINLVGPTQNYFKFSDFSKVVLSFDMLIGRLEILPILMLLAPQTWRKRFLMVRQDLVNHF